MDIHAALGEVARWCQEQTALGDPGHVEVECHATVWITIGEAAPPWDVRWERRCTAGASAPVAQLRYDVDNGGWTLHHGAGGSGWSEEDDSARAADIAPLLAEVAADRDGRFQGLPPGYRFRSGGA